MSPSCASKTEIVAPVGQATRAGHAPISVADRWREFIAWYAKRRTMAALARLDDRTLKDIGLSRSEIGSVVHGTPGERRLGYTERWQYASSNECPSEVD